MNALRLPPVYAITQAGKLGVDTLMLRLRTALQNSVRRVQVREKDMDAFTLRRLVLDVTRLCHAHHARVMVNGDINLARTAGADGDRTQRTRHRHAERHLVAAVQPLESAASAFSP